VEEAAVEGVGAGPVGRVAVFVAVVALAHPEKVGGEAQLFLGVGAGGVDGPEAVFRGPGGAGDAVLVADVLV